MKKITILFFYILFANNTAIAQSFQYNDSLDKTVFKGPIKTHRFYNCKKISVDTTQIHGNREKGMNLFSTKEYNEAGILKTEKQYPQTEKCRVVRRLLDEQNNLVCVVSGPCNHPDVSSEINARALFDFVEIEKKEKDFDKQIGLSTYTYKYDTANRRLSIYTKSIHSKDDSRDSIPNKIITFNEKNQEIKVEYRGKSNGTVSKKYKNNLMVEQHSESGIKWMEGSSYFKYDNQGRMILIKRTSTPDPENMFLSTVSFDSLKIEYLPDNVKLTRAFLNGSPYFSKKELVFQKKAGEDLPTFKTLEEIDAEIITIIYLDEYGNKIKEYGLGKNRERPISVTYYEFEYYEP